MTTSISKSTSKPTSRPKIGFAGMTHLGLVSAIAAAEKGFELVCFDTDSERISQLNAGHLPVSEPQLEELLKKNKTHILFSDEAKDLQSCDVIYIAPDVPTDDLGQSDLAPINALLDLVFQASSHEATLVVLSQVPPGFTRSKQQIGRKLYYQVETLIFGRAVERALFPERYIVGCADPKAPIPQALLTFLEAHACPILPMRFESAELAKISINMCLVASVTTANTLAELCEQIGADWSEIVPALKLDRRIGSYAYLAPGLGISGGNLERDLATVCRFASAHQTDAGMVHAWIANSAHRKAWPAKLARQLLFTNAATPVIAIWGLAYKENTHSVKNSPALVSIAKLTDASLRVFDPVVMWQDDWHPNAIPCKSALEALEGADALMILTPWPIFKEMSAHDIAAKLKGKIVIDPYGILQNAFATNLEVHVLGRS